MRDFFKRLIFGKAATDQGLAETPVLRRWRLILGQDAVDPDGASLGGNLGGQEAEMDRVLGYLFDREYAGDPDTYRDRTGGRGASSLAAPDWLGRVRELFPRSTAEHLTQTALRRYGIVELLTDERLLDTVKPDVELLKAVMLARGLLPKPMIAAARRIIREVVDELRRRMLIQIQRHFAGAVDRRRPSPLPLAKNFDARRTIRRNLRHYSLERREIVIEKAYFFSRLHRHQSWDVILLVDQSGSMLSSVIHAAVMASILRGLGGITTRLVVFDTAVVDLSEEADDPLEVLLRVQLGGGTNIAQALVYAEQLVRNPRRTIVVLISDFFEGGSTAELLASAGRLVDAGTVFLGLAALDERARPVYDRRIGQRLADLGAHVSAMTPDQLAEWLARRVRT